MRAAVAVLAIVALFVIAIVGLSVIWYKKVHTKKNKAQSLDFVVYPFVDDKDEEIKKGVTNDRRSTSTRKRRGTN